MANFSNLKTITKCSWKKGVIFILVSIVICYFSVRTNDFTSIRNWNRPSMKLLKDFGKETLINFDSSCEPILQEGKFKIEENYQNESCLEKDIIFPSKNYECMKKWEPKGCSMKFYSQRDGVECLRLSSGKTKYIFFIGDSRMRFLFSTFILFLANKLLPRKFDQNEYVFIEESRTNVSYICRLYMDDLFLKDIKYVKNISKEHPTLLIVGVTLHMMIKYTTNEENGLYFFIRNLRKAKKDLDEIGLNGNVLWFHQASKSFSVHAIKRKLQTIFPYTPYINLSVLAINRKLQKVFPYTLPINDSEIDEYDEKSLQKLKEYYILQLNLDPIDKLMYSFIPAYNYAAEMTLSDTTVKMWHSSRYIGESSLDDYMDRVHLPDYNNYNLMQIILNMICNKHMKLQETFCCSRGT